MAQFDFHCDECDKTFPRIIMGYGSHLVNSTLCECGEVAVKTPVQLPASRYDHTVKEL